ncbi:PPP4R2-domain-containing protein [Phascolomyces articulosus]|uniref:PPP4R2-domain-containing protein n=1 Tax=Phascolomyces articulosus TaxID=60185 RepID=A0AAD5KHP3_9FUNG|nr:PPP4R2-domain-containing protein [Phascolomyces articulosus]
MAEDNAIDGQIATITLTPTASSQTETQSLSDSGETTNEQPPRPLPDSIEIGDSLNNLEYHQGLLEIANTNQITQSWNDLKVAIKNAIVQQCEIIEKKEPTPEEWSNIESIKTNILHSLEQHERPPFTIQRLCELVLDPRKHYRMFIKYMNAIEKVLLVTSAWDDFAEHSGTNGMSGVSSSMEDGLFATEDSMINGVELEPITFEEEEEEQKEEDENKKNDEDKETTNDKKTDDTTMMNQDDNDNKNNNDNNNHSNDPSRVDDNKSDDNPTNDNNPNSQHSSHDSRNSDNNNNNTHDVTDMDVD